MNHDYKSVAQYAKSESLEFSTWTKLLVLFIIRLRVMWGLVEFSTWTKSLALFIISAKHNFSSTYYCWLKATNKHLLIYYIYAWNTMMKQTKHKGKTRKMKAEQMTTQLARLKTSAKITKQPNWPHYPPHQYLFTTLPNIPKSPLRTQTWSSKNSHDS